MNVEVKVKQIDQQKDDAQAPVETSSESGTSESGTSTACDQVAHVGELEELYTTFRSWFSIQAQVRAVLLLAYATVIGLAFTIKNPSIFVVSLFLVVAAYLGEMKMRTYLAPFVYRALQIAPNRSALSTFLKIAYRADTIAALQRQKFEDLEPWRIRSIMVRDFARSNLISYPMAFILSLALLLTTLLQ